MKISKTELKDIDSIYSIEKECFDEPWPKEEFSLEVNNKNSEFIKLIDDDENIIGYYIVWISLEDADIGSIAIKKDKQGNGYGEYLFKDLLDRCKLKGVKSIHLEVNENNIKARNLYEKFGFNKTRIRKNYYKGADGIEMVKELLMTKKILAIESSCDETAAAIIDEDLNILSSVVTSQIDVHARFGGVIPEIASRMHVEQISIIVEEAIKQADVTIDDIDAIAYTIGPGLIGSLHVGAIAAKTLAFFYKKPLIGVHHLKGHIFINELIKPLNYPVMALVVSGGHSELVYMENDDSFKIIGTTLDDAVGESYDKVARVIGLEYPGGPKIDKLSKEGKKNYTLPTPKVDGYNFSFSGLKNAALQLVNKMNMKNEEINKADLAYAFQETALNSLVNKTCKALEEYKDVKTVVVAGGVAANSRLRELMIEKIKGPEVILPPLKYCTDNATMIGVAAWHYFRHNKFVLLDAESKPNMSIED